VGIHVKGHRNAPVDVRLGTPRPGRGKSRVMRRLIALCCELCKLLTSSSAVHEMTLAVGIGCQHVLPTEDILGPTAVN